ncbi:hypothetical protein SS50377_23824 [Spironucleus salmonicida]|uniref:Uncharacterized protein n=1 Tax=Spironucleus salmonicida TaxID=348837 RepID=V6LQH7_9EUKA|nr:hypothetical protein SS50377_23824 [Spironucleus salmonicida]|eukprot:EST46503.1 Hypothetical protein SS50377_13584 [Spironucleus salmonicida]
MRKAKSIQLSNLQITQTQGNPSIDYIKSPKSQTHMNKMFDTLEINILVGTQNLQAMHKRLNKLLQLSQDLEQKVAEMIL